MRIVELQVLPAERLIVGPAATITLEPLVMALLIELTEHAGMLVPRRRLFEKLWGNMPVGDDSLNRVAAVLRRRLKEAGARSLQIETVPAAGYVLKLAHEDFAVADEEVQNTIEEATDSWRLGLPRPDYLSIALLERAAEVQKGCPRIHGLLALQHRHAAEYGDSDQAPVHVLSCEKQARRALELDPKQAEALTALVAVRPIFGSWSPAFLRLSEICAETDDHPVPSHDLAILEMATGQVKSATVRRERLSAQDPLAAIFAYKAVYQYWSLGQQTAMNHAADQALQLWPRHPAVWSARFWTLAYSGRLAAAEEMTRHAPVGFSTAIVDGLGSAIRNLSNNREDTIAAHARQLAGLGPAQAIIAFFLLGLVNDADDAFEVAGRYFLQQQDQPVPIRPAADGPRINEQQRRLTQILFTPACAAMRKDPRFTRLTSEIGLEEFWGETGIVPDYRAT